MGDDDNAAKRYQHHRQSLPFLPDEIINDILLRLPVRSLLIFKCVCKSWQTLISNPQFANNHFRNLNLNPTITHQRLFCYQTPHKIISFPMKSLLENSSEVHNEPPVEFKINYRFRVLGSCNGLLCLFDMNHGYVKLWNPCISFESKESPRADCFDKHRRSKIGYDGFGYDYINDKYKVLVSVRRVPARSPYYRYKEYATQIYTFGENHWTTIQNFPCSTIKPVGKFLGGTLNWLVVKTRFSYNQSVILSFDLVKETYKELLLPENDGAEACNHMLGVMNNCLCVCFGSIETHWNLWVMKKYGVAESWTRLTVIPYEQLHNHVQHRLDFIKPVFILENRRVVRSIINKFVLLNLDNVRWDECFLGSSSRQHIYYESLVSPQL